MAATISPAELAIDAALDKVRHHPKMVIAEDYEFVLQTGAISSVQYENGEAANSCREKRVWLGMRVLHRKRLGSATTVFCTLDGINSLVERAFEAAECTAVDPWFRFPISRAPKKEQVPVTGFKENRFMDSFYPDLVSQPLSLDERYEIQEFETFITRKSEKAPLQQKRSLGLANFSILVQGQEEICRLTETRGISEGREEHKARWLERLLHKSSRLHKPKSPRQPMPGGRVVIDGSVVSRILETLTVEFSGRRALSEGSLFGSQFEKKILPEVISIIDDGTLEQGLGTAKFDMEGVPMQRSLLVDRGVLKNFFHDSVSSARFNRTSTGNLLQCSFGQTPDLGPSNLYLVPSTQSLLNLIEGMGSGFYLESLASSVLVLNQAGELNLVGHGWIVSKGDPIQPVCNVTLTFKPIDFFRAVSEVGNDLDFYGCCGAPSVFLNEIPLRELCR